MLNINIKIKSGILEIFKYVSCFIWDINDFILVIIKI